MKKSKKALLVSALGVVTFFAGYGISNSVSNNKKEKAKQNIEVRFDNYTKSNQAQIQHERDSLHSQAEILFHSMITEYNDSVSKADRRTHYAYGAIPVFPRGVFGSSADESDDKELFLSTVLGWASKEQSDFYKPVISDLIEAGYNGQEIIIQEWKQTWSPNSGSDIMPVDHVSHIDDVDLAEFERNNWENENTKHIIPDFNKSTFKKRKNELDKICARLHALDDMEKQLNQTSELKNAILADVKQK